MKKIRNFNILTVLVMIVLLSFSSNLLKAEVRDSIILYGGRVRQDSDSVLIALSTIRKANIKLIEAEQNKQLVESFQKIVEMQKTQIDILDVNLRERNTTIVNLNNQLNEQIDNSRKYKRQRNIFAGTSVLALIVLILM